MMKTNIKMRVTPEQSEQVQKIIKGDLLDIDLSYPFLYLTEEIGLKHGSSEEIFEKDETEEISSELFIRTNGTCEETKTEENKMEWIEYNKDKEDELKEGKNYIFQEEYGNVGLTMFVKNHPFWKRVTAYMELPKPYEKPKSLKERLNEAVEKYCYEFSDEEWKNNRINKYFICYRNKENLYDWDFSITHNSFPPFYFEKGSDTNAFINSFTTDELMQIMKGEVK